MTPLDHLVALRALLAPEGAWLPGHTHGARNDRGGACQPGADVACRWGLHAASRRIGGGARVEEAVTRHLRHAAGVVLVGPWSERPERTQAEVLAALDRAIGFARAEARA